MLLPKKWILFVEVTALPCMQKWLPCLQNWLSCLWKSLHQEGQHFCKSEAVTTRNVDHPESSVWHFCTTLDICIGSEPMQLTVYIDADSHDYGWVNDSGYGLNRLSGADYMIILIVVSTEAIRHLESKKYWWRVPDHTPGVISAYFILEPSGERPKCTFWCRHVFMTSMNYRLCSVFQEDSTLPERHTLRHISSSHSRTSLLLYNFQTTEYCIGEDSFLHFLSCILELRNKQSTISKKVFWLCHMHTTIMVN